MRRDRSTRWAGRAKLMGFSLLALCCAGTPDAGREPVLLTAPAYGPEFWDHWGDGQAELAGYELTYSRYGEPRSGTAVAIFVTETFSGARHVKHESGGGPDADVFQVLKLNLVQDFPTGIYDYNLMTSAFVALEPRLGRPAGSPAKISFSSQEWCGQVYAQVRFEHDGLRLDSHSYFDGEADRELPLDYPADGLAEDTLPVWARGLAAPALAPGTSRLSGQLRPSTGERRWERGRRRRSRAASPRPARSSRAGAPGRRRASTSGARAPGRGRAPRP